MNNRRILCLSLPDLPCEMATLRREAGVSVSKAMGLNNPLAVVLIDDTSQEIRPNTPIYAVTQKAKRLGICAGQTVASARAIANNLDIRTFSQKETELCLARLAELALTWGPTVSFEFPDSIWVDITGAAHLVGGEDALLTEACERIRALGHRVRGAIASGPMIARAVARFGVAQRTVVLPGHEQAHLAALPVQCLELDRSTEAWLIKLGVFSAGDVAKQPRTALASRLGNQAERVLSLLDGDDRTPLNPYNPPKKMRETIEWDDAVDGVEPLLFVLRGVLSRACARLEGRGESMQAFSIELGLDRKEDSTLTLSFELPSPLYKMDPLLRIIRARLENTTLPVGVRSLALVSDSLVEAPKMQLDLGGTAQSALHALPNLVAELEAELGADRVGLLQDQNSHIPEKSETLVPFAKASKKTAIPTTQGQLALWPSRRIDAPTRLLPEPLLVQGSLNKDGFLLIEGVPYHVCQVDIAERLDDVEWWTEKPTQRDYVRAWLAGGGGVFEAWIARDRKKRKMYLHGWFS